MIRIRCRQCGAELEEMVDFAGDAVNGNLGYIYHVISAIRECWLCGRQLGFRHSELRIRLREEEIYDS